MSKIVDRLVWRLTLTDRQRRTALWLLGVLLLIAISIVIPDKWLLLAALVMLHLMVLPATYFPVFYTLAFRWWGGHLGRALFIKALGLALLVDASVAIHYFGEGAWVDEFRFVTFAVVLIGLTYQSVVMTRVRVKAGRRRDRGTIVPGDDLSGVNMHH